MFYFWIAILTIVSFVLVKMIFSRLFRKNKEFKEKYYNNFVEKNEFILDSECDINSYSKIMIDRIHKKFAINGSMGIQCFDYKDLMDFEIKENGSSIIQGKVASTLVGGFLLGGIGALAGSSGRRTVTDVCNDLILKVYVNNSDIKCVTEKFNRYSIDKNSEEYQQLSKRVDEVVGILKYIKLQNEYSRADNERVIEESVQEIETKSQKSSNGFEQLEKLAELKEKGIITNEEFEESKKKILSKL